jgi:hypothetical protein
MDLKELLEKIADKKAEASINVEDVDHRIRAQAEALKNNAATELKVLEDQYKSLASDLTDIVLVTGENAEDFCKKAEAYGVPSVDASYLRSRLVSTLVKSQSGPLYTSNSHFVLLNVFAQIRTEFNISQLPTPVVSPSDRVYDVPVEEAVENMLRKNYGNELESAIVKRQIGEAALKAKFSGKKNVVLVYNAIDGLSEQMLPRQILATEVPSSIDLNDNNIKKLLGEVRAMIKSKNKGQIVG